MSDPPPASSLGLVLCRTCEKVLAEADLETDRRCPRCGFVVARGPVDETATVLAWLLAGVILYIPANALPVMNTSGLEGTGDNTILSGIIGFWQSGSYGVAALIFVASVAVPLTKFAAIALLIVCVRYRRDWMRLQRAKLYRAVEFIGYWSMLDVIVVAMTCSLVQLKSLGAAEPRIGIVFFCAVVVTTMLSARAFDPRLVWRDPLKETHS